MFSLQPNGSFYRFRRTNNIFDAEDVLLLKISKNGRIFYMKNLDFTIEELKFVEYKEGFFRSLTKRAFYGGNDDAERLEKRHPRTSNLSFFKSCSNVMAKMAENLYVTISLTTSRLKTSNQFALQWILMKPVEFSTTTICIEERILLEEDHFI